MQVPQSQTVADSSQTLPQAPQLLGSKAKSTQEPVHNVRPGEHAVQVPWLQYGVGPPHALPHAPQLTGSQPRLVHTPSQSTAPTTQS